MKDNDETRQTTTRRQMLVGIGGILGAAAGSTSAARAQTATETDGGGQPRITTKAVIPEVGPPFRGNYVGQFVVFTDPTPREDISPGAVGDCDFADWPPSQTRGYQVLLADRLTDEPRGVTVGAFLDGNEPRIDPGKSFIVDRTHPCPNDYLGLELEAVPVETFVPERGGVDHPLIAEESGPTVAPNETATGEPGVIDAPGQPGFGVLAATASVAGAALLRRLVAPDDDDG